ncbi:MAG TPA: hypothetical protein HA306_01060 [Methanosarcina sp.]|nr:hypothetical protein [Methanosarcina sp.]
MKEIIGCIAEGRFVYCIDCKYQESEQGCREFIALHNAELKLSFTKPKKQKILLAQVSEVRV